MGTSAVPFLNLAPSLQTTRSRYVLPALFPDGVQSQFPCLLIIASTVHLLKHRRCLAYPHELETTGAPHFREHSEALVDTFTAKELCDVFGVITSVKVSPVAV